MPYETMDQGSDIIMPEDLREIPLSGSFEEHDFGTGGLRCWVKFTDSQYREWCGKFLPGTKPVGRKILWLPGTRNFFILASGRGYIVNADTRELIARTESDMLEDAVVVPESNAIVVTNGLTIGLFGPDGGMWESERISLDGIRFQEVFADRVTGKLNDMTDTWCDFTFYVKPCRIESAWSYADLFRSAPVSQIRLAKIVVATFGAVITGLGLALFWSERDVYSLIPILLGVFCMLIALFGSRGSAKRRRNAK